MASQHLYRVTIFVVAKKTLLSKDTPSANCANLDVSPLNFFAILDIDLFEDRTGSILNKICVSSDRAFRS